MRRALLPLLLLWLPLPACLDASSTACGDGFCRAGLVCSERHECVPPGAYCGDGILDPGEACDDGAGNDNTVPDACRTDCQPHRCGDGILDGDEQPLCLRDAPGDRVHVALEPSAAPVAGATPRLLIHDDPSPRSAHALASLDGSDTVTIVSWDQTASNPAVPPAHALVDETFPIAGGTWWDAGAGAELIVFAHDGRAQHIALVDGFWQNVEPIDFSSVGGLVEVQPFGALLMVAAPARVQVGRIDPQPGGAIQVWHRQVGFDVLGGTVLAARVGTLGHASVVVVEVETPVGRELRSYEVALATGEANLTGTWPLASADVLLELQVGVTGSLGAGEIVGVFTDRVEIFDAALAPLARRTWPTPLVWAHAARAVWDGTDVLVGGAAYGTWVGQLVPVPAEPPPTGAPVEVVMHELEDGVDGPLTLDPPSDGSLADLDRDGWPDLVRRRAAELDVQRAGDGPWSSPRRQDGNGSPMAVGDLDGDGHPELLSYDFDGGEIDWQPSLPGRGLDRPSAVMLMNEVAAPVRLLTCDVDGDRHDELIAQLEDGATTTLAVLRLRPAAAGDPNGANGLDVLWSEDRVGIDGRLAAADFEADGACDLLFVDATGDAQLHVGLPGQGITSAVDLHHFDVAGGIFDLRTLAAFEGGARVVLSTPTEVYWARGAELRHSDSAWSHRRLFQLSAALPGWFSERGAPELLGVDASGAYLWSEPADAAPVTLDAELEQVLVGRVASGDLNRDGLTDLVVTSEKGLTVLLTRDHRAGAAQRFSVQPGYPLSFGMLADLDGDGAADWITTGPRHALLVRYGQRGIVAWSSAAP
jgi:hypothetical protein